MATANDPFKALTTLETTAGKVAYYRLDAVGKVDNLPYTIKVLLESVLLSLIHISEPTRPY